MHSLITNLWNSIGALRGLSAWLNWLSIGLVFLGGFLQLGKFLVDRRERHLASLIQEERLNPNRQPIRIGSATVEVLIESDEQINTHYADTGGYLAFGKGTDGLMLLSSFDCFARQTGRHEVMYRGVFALDATDASVGQPVAYLRDTEFVQIGFGPIPRDSRVKGGKALVTINSAVQIEIPIPAQTMDGDRIMVRDLARLLSQVR